MDYATGITARAGKAKQTQTVTLDLVPTELYSKDVKHKNKALASSCRLIISFRVAIFRLPILFFFSFLARRT